MYKVLVVDDSALMRKIICDIINEDKDFHVVDISADGEDTYNKIKNNVYDMVILDMVLPKMTGLQVLTKLYQENVKANVILVSSSLKEDAESTVLAMERGALDFVVKPYRSTPESRVEFRDRLLSSLRAVARGSVGKRSSFPERPAATRTVPTANTAEQPRKAASVASPVATGGTVKASNGMFGVANPPRVIKGKKLIALACSTGGPQALHTFVPMLPATLMYPVVLVQHMPEGFTASLAKRLDQISQIKVKEAEQGEYLEPGCVYIAPGGRHLEIYENANHEAYCHINDMPPVNSLRPCADVMYQSLAETSYEEIICVVLTGMGADGSDGIEYLKKYRSTYVISEDASTCVVYGMPKSVEQRGLSQEVVPLQQVAGSIIRKLRV